MFYNSKSVFSKQEQWPLFAWLFPAFGPEGKKNIVCKTTGLLATEMGEVCLEGESVYCKERVSLDGGIPHTDLQVVSCTSEN